MNLKNFISEIAHEISPKNNQLFHQISINISNLNSGEFYHFVFPIPINSENFELENKSDFDENIHIQILQKSNSFHFCLHPKSDVEFVEINFNFTSSFTIFNHNPTLILPNFVYFDENNDGHEFNIIPNIENNNHFPDYKIVVNNAKKLDENIFLRTDKTQIIEYADKYLNKNNDELSSKLFLIIAESDVNPDDFRNKLNEINRTDRVNIFSAKSKKWLFQTPKPLSPSDSEIAIEFIQNAENNIINNNFNFFANINFDFENANFVYLHGKKINNYYAALSNQIHFSPIEFKQQKLFSSDGYGIFSHSLNFTNNFQPLFPQENDNFYYPFFLVEEAVQLRQIRRRRIYDPGIDYELKYEFRAFGFDLDASDKVESYFKKYSYKLFNLLKSEMKDGDLEKMCSYSLNLDRNGKTISFNRKASNFDKILIFNFVEEMLESININYKGASSENLYICLFDIFYS